MDEIPIDQPLEQPNVESKKLHLDKFKPFVIVGTLFLVVIIFISSVVIEKQLSVTKKGVTSQDAAAGITIPVPTTIPRTSTSPKQISTPSPTQTSRVSTSPTASPKFETPITIKGDAECVSQTEAALKLLQDKAPLHYANILKTVGVIECADAGSGMYAYENPPRYKVGTATRDAGTVWYAGTIAHDANHSKLYHDYLSSHPSESVPDDIWTGASAEAQCLDVQYDALSKMGAEQSVLDHVKNSKDSEYWNVPYADRWW